VKTAGLVARPAVLLAIGVGSVVWLADRIGQLGAPAGALASTHKVTASFTDATGLTSGDDVRLAGVRVGKVSSVTVEKGKAVVALAIDDRYRIPAGSDLELHWRNLLGQRFVLAVPPASARPGGPSLADGARLGPDRTRAAADLSQLVNSTEPLLGKLDTPTLNRVATTFAAALQGREQAMNQAIGDSAALVSTLSTRADAIGSSIQDLAVLLEGIAAHDDDVGRLLDSLAGTTEALAARSGDLGRAVSGTHDLARVLDRVVAANGATLEEVLGQSRLILDGTVANRAALAEGLRTLPWATAAITRATTGGGGDWWTVYARGVGIVNGWVSEPVIGPDPNDAGPDDTAAPDALLGTPEVPLPAVPETDTGPLVVNPSPGASPTHSSGLSTLLAPLLGGGQQ
jgi:phospholipid/cholesterol/gamma-HCH transport system substrate-binding protein